MSVILYNWRKYRHFVCNAIYCPLNLTTGKKKTWGTRGGETEQYVHLSNIHMCLHVLHTLEYHLGAKNPQLFAIINIKLNLNCFTKLPSSITQGFVWKQLSKPSLVKQMKPTWQKKRYLIISDQFGGWGTDCFFILFFLHTNSEACAVHNIQREMSKITSKRRDWNSAVTIHLKQTAQVYYTQIHEACLPPKF